MNKTDLTRELKFYSKPSITSQMHFINKRKFNKKYLKRQPQFSETQNFLFISDIAISSLSDSYVDVFDTSSDDFFTSKGEINQADPSFMFSFALSPEVAESFVKIQTLPGNDNYAAVIGTNAL